MSVIALISVINHYQIYGLHLFWDSLEILLVPLFNSLSASQNYFVEEQQWYYLTHSKRDKGVHIFPKGISSEENLIERFEFDFAYFKGAVQHFNLIFFLNIYVTYSPK